MEIYGKAAVVTGSSRGIGRATAVELARRGCSVTVNYFRSQVGAEETVSRIESLGGRAIPVQADVSDDSACRRLIAEALKAFGRLDILVNNAGTTEFIAHDDLAAVTRDVWDRILGVNLIGPFQCVRAAREVLRESGNAEIVNTASIAGVWGSGSSIPYSASKAGLINLTIALARALGPEIRVNAVAPSFVDGDWLREGLGENFEASKESQQQRSVLDSVCTSDDIADAIVGLITGSDKVTGQTLLCDAGINIGPRASMVRR